PVADARFSGFKQSTLDLGRNTDTLTVDLAVAGLATFVNTNQGDDTVTVNQIGDSTRITGGTGQSTVQVNVPNLPTDPKLRNLTKLQLTGVTNLVVDNHTNPTGVQWTVSNGELSGSVGNQTQDLLSVDGAATARILGGTGTNTLSIE